MAGGLAPTLAGLQRGEHVAQGRRVLAHGRVEGFCWHRGAVAGEVVAPNGRRFRVELEVDASSRRLVRAACSCSPKLRLEAPCPHLAALALVATNRTWELVAGPAADPAPDAVPELPGERFAGSLWWRVAEALLERFGAVAKVGPGAVAGSRLVTAADQTMVIELVAPEPAGDRQPAGQTAVRIEPLTAVVGLLAADGPLTAASVALSPLERRLVDATLTAEETVLAVRGSRTRRQALEASAWWQVARLGFVAAERLENAFRSPEAPPPLRPLTIERRGASLWLVLRSAGGELRVLLLPAAVDAAWRLAGSQLGALGVIIGLDRVTPSLRLDLAGETLRMVPVYLIERVAATVTSPSPAGTAHDPIGGSELEVHERSAVEALRCGGLLLEPSLVVARPDPAAVVLLPVANGRRPFAEPEAGAQASFDLTDTYRPSPVGQSLDRLTVVPASEVARFLTRHSDEIRVMPRILLPPALAAGGPAEPDDAEVVVFSMSTLGSTAGQTIDRYELGLSYRISGELVPFAAIWEARRAGRPLLVARGVLIDPAHPRFSWMDTLDPNQDVATVATDRSGDTPTATSATRLRLAPLAVCRLRSYLPQDHRLVSGLEGDQGATALAALERLAALSPEAPPPPPESLGLALFDFQRTGYAWLWFLWRNGFGGLLADDMGLGKTYQAIALIAAAVATESRPLRVLVATPASVLPHWEDKLRTLLPGVRLTCRRGADRGELPADGVVLTSYGTLRNDADALAGRRFDLVLLDEAQTVKNRDALTSRVVRQLTGGVVIGLTGTPVENSVGELHALLDLALPGYLPGPAAFERSFARPIAQGDLLARQRLARLVHPFVLRRTKAQVLTSLPAKIADRRTCTMTEAQQALYRQTLRSKRAVDLRGTLAAGGKVPVLHVFALLSRLKQLCNHPDSLSPQGTPPSGVSSGKWELFVELLDEALGSGHKVVVFSQYLRMLDLVAGFLDTRGIGHVGLRGSTRDRATPVARFQTDPDCRVFLASLKAAGVGIDLTAASVVIHLDRWWNQAREDQATDRVHRLGQRQAVQVITLVTRESIEERIDQLIAEKGRLAKDLLPEDDAQLIRRFSREELRALLAP